MPDVQFGRVVQEQVHGRENRAIVSLVLLSGESYGTDVRCAECRSEKTSGNWAIPKTKGKYKPGDRLCNVCYRRELVSLKAEAEEESTSEV